MMALLLSLLPVQDEPLEKLIEKLGAEQVEVRTKAEADLVRRGEEALRTLDEALKRATDPAERLRLQKALEQIAGAGSLPLERVKAAKIRLKTGPGPLDDVLRALAKQSRITIDLGIDPVRQPELPDLEFEDAPLDEALDRICKAMGGMWMIHEDRIVALAPGRTSVRGFDVRDLTMGVADEEALPMEPRAEAPQEAPEPRCLLTGEDTALLVKNSVRPGNWEEADGKALTFINGLLIVRNDPPTLALIEPFLKSLRKKLIVELRLEVEACAVKPGAAGGAEDLRKAGRILASFERTARDARRVALWSGGRTLLVTRYGEEGDPVLETFRTGVLLNVRATLDNARKALRVETEACLSRLSGVEKRPGPKGEVQLPSFSSHSASSAEDGAIGAWRTLARFGAGAEEVVIVGRFTPVEEP